MYRKISVLTLLLTLFVFGAASLSAQKVADDDVAAADSVAADTICIDSLTEAEVQMPWDERVKLQLQALANEADNSYYHTGIAVYDLTADSLLFGYNNKKVMRPASTQKIMTAISALSVLGARHEFRTRAYYTGSISTDSTLNGDIYVVGDFDPMYNYGDLRELARSIRDLGIKTINGTIYGDASMKSKDLYGNGWCWDDVPSKFEPALCALMFDRGTLSPKSSSYPKDLMFNPAEHFVKVLSDEVAECGVTNADTTAASISFDLKDCPTSGIHPFYTKTRTVDQVMQRMLKNSDNLHAEAVFFQLAHFNTGRRCTWKDGARQVENVIRKAGGNTSYVEVADGSGVSLYNYTTPDTQVAMLRYAYNNKSIYQYFYPALPIAGRDGTLSDRMRSGNASHNVHAKTGTVEGVISLAGYVTASNGHVLAFSILNNGVLKASTARNYQDRVCQELAR